MLTGETKIVKQSESLEETIGAVRSKTGMELERAWLDFFIL